MQHPKNPYIHYNTRPKTHFIAKIAFALIAILIVVAIVALVKDKKNGSARENVRDVTTAKGPLVANMGESIHTRFFDVTVEKISVTDKVTDLNQAHGLSEERNSQYLVIEISLKNLDKESKLMPAGELQIESGAETMKYERSETILKDGWGELMDNIGTGETMKTKLVYKVPAGIHGKVYYYPEILYSKDRIFLTDL